MSEEKPVFFIPDTAKEVGDYRRKVIENYPTLRDGFAQAALGGLLSRESHSLNHEQLAGLCYEIADAMLKERNK